MGISKVALSAMLRNAIKRGPTSSDAWNDSFGEVVTDLTKLSSAWNDTLNPLLSTLPSGLNDLDAFRDGLDGATIYVDHSAIANVADTTYFNLIKNRPNTIKEQFDKVQAKLIDLQQQIDALKT